MLGFAAEFEIDRPATEAGWIVLILVGVVLLFVLNEGLQKITGKTYRPFLDTIYFLVAVLIFVLVAADRDNRGSDPLVEVDVLDEGDFGGTHAESDRDHHLIDPDHTHDSDR